MPHLRRNALVLLLAGLLLAGFGKPAAAHVDVDVADGQYVMEVGFRDEPALQDQPNAVYIHVAKYATGGAQPVDGLAGSLQAEVSRDGQSKTLPFVPMGDGAYEAAFVPSATGDYTFRVFGEIDGNAVDESLTSGPQTFNSVEPLTALAFPAPSDVPDAQATAVAQAQAAADQARTFAYIALAVGALALIAALALGLRRRPAQAVTETVIAPEPGQPGRLIK